MPRGRRTHPGGQIPGCCHPLNPPPGPGGKLIPVKPMDWETQPSIDVIFMLCVHPKAQGLCSELLHCPNPLHGHVVRFRAEGMPPDRGKYRSGEAPVAIDFLDNSLVCISAWFCTLAGLYHVLFRLLYCNTSAQGYRSWEAALRKSVSTVASQSRPDTW